MKTLRLHVEELEQRIAPDVNGTGGYDGQPGNQSNSQGNPSGSANPARETQFDVQVIRHPDVPQRVEAHQLEVPPSASH